MAAHVADIRLWALRPLGFVGRRLRRQHIRRSNAELILRIGLRIDELLIFDFVQPLVSGAGFSGDPDVLDCFFYIYIIEFVFGLFADLLKVLAKLEAATSLMGLLGPRRRLGL